MDFGTVGQIVHKDTGVVQSSQDIAQSGRGLFGLGPFGMGHQDVYVTGIGLSTTVRTANGDGFREGRCVIGGGHQGLQEGVHTLNHCPRNPVLHIVVVFDTQPLMVGEFCTGQFVCVLLFGTTPLFELLSCDVLFYQEPGFDGADTGEGD